MQSYKNGKWAKQILAQRQEDGLWGNFHTLSCPVPGKSYTTEQAIRRLYYLGYTANELVNMSDGEFLNVFERTFTPMNQIALNMGFETWKY